MILHLITDDKFADYAIEQFLLIDSRSTFILIKSSVNENVKNIKNIDKIRQIVDDSDEFYRLFENLNAYSAVITHGLFYPWQEKILNKTPQNVKKGWVFWGGDIYSRPDLKLKYLSPKSKILYYGKSIKNIFKGLRPGNFFCVDKSVFQGLDYCLTDVHEDFEFVKKYTSSDMKEIWYNYYSIEDTIGVLKEKKVDGNNILIGNSGTLENNHLDVFSTLKKYKLSDRNIIIPLSYGELWLRNILVKAGKKVFGSSFIPLVDFLDRDTYNNYLLSCNVIIMNHFRPQAMGNLITSFWLGAKVYMSRNSLLFTYFKRHGLLVYSIEDELKKNNINALKGLDDNQISHNRKILNEIYGKEQVMTKVKILVDELTEKKNN